MRSWGLSQWEWQNASLAENTAIAGRNTRASNRENNQATFQRVDEVAVTQDWLQATDLLLKIQNVELAKSPIKADATTTSEVDSRLLSSTFHQ